jgi:hypothetical protein
LFASSHCLLRWAKMSVGANLGVAGAIALGATIGVVIGILVSLTTDVPVAPEGGLVLGALVGWLLRRNRS